MIRRLRLGDYNFGIVRRARTWFIVSGVILLIAGASLAIRGVNAGLEFRGGTAFQFQASERSVLDVADVRSALSDADVEEATVQEIGDNGFLVQTEQLSTEVQEQAVNALSDVSGIEAREINITAVGAKWGAQITNKAIRALIIFLVVLVIYLSIRLEPKMAGAALVALVHDLVATAGLYTLTGFEVTPATVIALLTIMGYSLYDTVVIFDRVKERTTALSAAGRFTYSQTANAALNEVLVRSLNTTAVSLLPVGSLLFVGSYLLGAQTLRELALALFVGIGVGAYSSVFIATPVLAIWKEREQRWATLRARITARGAEAPPPTRVSTPTAPQPVPVPAKPSSPPLGSPATPAAGAAATKSGSQSGAATRSGPPRRRKRRKRRRR